MSDRGPAGPSPHRRAARGEAGRQRSRPSRRQVLGALGGLGLAGLAGCAQTPAGTTTGTSPAGTSAAPSATAGAGADPDLREANVVDVAVESGADGHRLEVTLYHDDDGEDGYADWWQVEALDGNRLGRRDLLHPHSTAPFTRSATVAVPDGTDCVVVRGHDQTHGYGGRAVLLDVRTGATRSLVQGPEPQPVGPGDCPE